VVQKGVIPPTTNLTKVDPTCLGLRHVMHRPIEQKVEVASSDSFGFGGHNTCIVVGRYRE
jgi:3-oxoacyl-[acyl-carrier-protein] synthase II